jgi:putative ABC transport system ATP-binding protein
MKPVIEVSALRKTYGSGETAVHALRGSTSPRFPVGTSPSWARPVPESPPYSRLGCLDVRSSGEYTLDCFPVSELNER